MTLLEAIQSGPANARRKLDLAKDLGWFTKNGKPDTRRVEDAVQEARLKGAPIVSTQAGYFVTDDPAELLACSKRLRSRLFTQMRTARALRLTSVRMTRPTLFDFKDVA